VPEDIRLVVDIISKQTKASQRLITDLLDLSRLRSGRFEISLEEVDAHEVVDQSVRLTPRPEGKEVRIDLEEGLRVRADPFRLGQVFGNLLTNAYKYGGDTIEIHGRANECVVLEVRDDGPGLPAEMEADIFEPFVRGPQRKISGSGLGLSITAGLVAAQGGSIRYRRGEPGAVFVIELPSAG
jgi:signal transduction histidine kinase